MDRADDNIPTTNLVEMFDSVCFRFGDRDAVVMPNVSFCYLELQEYSKVLAAQLQWRFRPAYVLVDCRGHVAAELVALLACMRLGVPFVPVSASDQHAGEGRMGTIVKTLRENCGRGTVAAVVCCDDDQDPILGVFENADVHQILFVASNGSLQEALNVPDLLTEECLTNDNLYVLFTSGTSGSSPKAVVGSQNATVQRLQWFHQEFAVTEPPFIHRIGRRTRLTFVDSITELFGAVLFPPSQLIAVDPAELQAKGLAALLDQGTTQLTLLPSQLDVLLSSSFKFPHLSSLRRVIISGEPCNASLLDKFRQRCPEAQLINLYGQTETTGDVLFAALSQMDPSDAVRSGIVAVGKPLPGCHLESTTENELIISGSCLSNGYLGKGKFQSFPTGDIGFCCSKNGCWYVQGRKGDVQKVNGILTSPAEVETAVAQLFPNLLPVAAAIVDGSVYAISEGDPKRQFDRQQMKEKGGYPWNLIPKQIWTVPRIPRGTGGAQKTDRSRVRQLVQEKLANDRPCSEVRMDGNSIESILLAVLNVPKKDLDANKSFTELGGDSAAAVAFLYELRSRNMCRKDLTAIDVLQSESIHLLLSKEPVLKRQKSEHVEGMLSDFLPREIRRYSKSHSALQFRACVDSSPMCHEGFVYGACQGGVVMRMNLQSLECQHYHFKGWMIEADLTISHNLLIVCAYKRTGEEGLVCAMLLDLSSVVWCRIYSCGAVKTSPVVSDGRIVLVAGRTLISGSVRNDLEDCGGKSDELSHGVSSRALVLENGAGSKVLCYMGSDWESGMTVVDESDLKTHSVACDFGPVYKNPQNLSPTQGSITDSHGCLHIFSLVSSKKFHLSTKPLSAPAIAGDSIIVGGYDGIVRCIKVSDISNIVWEQPIGAVVYAKPLPMLDGRSVVVCTTGGDIIRLSIHDGTIAWRCKVDAEIWSDPICLPGNQIAFGGRDSRLHLLSVQ